MQTGAENPDFLIGVKVRMSENVIFKHGIEPLKRAIAALARLKELHPDISIAWIERHVPYTPGPMAKFLEGMRKAGLE